MVNTIVACGGLPTTRISLNRRQDVRAGDGQLVRQWLTDHGSSRPPEGRSSMTKAILTLALLIGAFGVGLIAFNRPTPATSVRLDIPAGYFRAPNPSIKMASPIATGNDCPSDCVNFDSGYAWAEKLRLSRPEQCQGRGRPFVSGCLTYITEQGATVTKTK